MKRLQQVFPGKVYMPRGQHDAISVCTSACFSVTMPLREAYSGTWQSYILSRLRSAWIFWGHAVHHSWKQSVPIRALTETCQWHCCPFCSHLFLVNNIWKSRMSGERSKYQHKAFNAIFFAQPETHFGCAHPRPQKPSKLDDSYH